MKRKRRATGPSSEVQQLVIERSGGRCERCRAPAVDIHHRKARGMGGTRDPRINCASNLVALCRGCHELIESRRTRSYGQGWLIPNASRRAAVDIPVSTGLHGRVWLRDDGSVTPVTDLSQ